MKALTYFAILGLTLGGPWTALDAQSTSIDLTTQGRVRVGSQLPQGCRTGQLFLVTSNTQWPVLFVCSAGAWSSPGLPSLDSDGEGKVMRWNAETSQWTAAGLADSAGLGIAFTGPTLSVEDAIVPMYYAGSGAPSMDCVTGRDFYVDTDGGALHFCKAPGQWQQAANSAHTHSADALTSGTLAITLMPATVARRDVGNAFTAGQRQSMGHDSSNAGLRLIPAAGDPSAAQDGDLWYNSSTNRFRRKQNGSVSDWDSTGSGVSLSQPNTFSAGQRQSMGHDSSNAGLRLIPAAGDPSAAQDGDLWYNASTNRFRRMQNGSVSDWDSSGGGGGSTINFLDRSNFWMIEDFTPSGTAAAGAQYQGAYRWVLVQIGAGGCAQTGTANGNSNSPGLLALVAPGTANTGCDVALDGDNDNKLTSNLVSKTWYAEWTFLPDLAASSVVARVGIGGSTGVAASISAVSCRIDPASSPNYLFDLHTSGTLTRSVDSGVAYSADGATHTCRIRGDGAKWYFAIANGAGAYSAEKTLCPSGCDLAAALPTFAVTPFASVTTTNASLKRIYLDRFAMVIQGLVR